MEHLEEARMIIAIVASIAGLLFVTVIPTIVKYVKTWKEYKAAKTEAERQAAINEMLGYANELVAAAEETYKKVDTLLKQDGGKGSGAVKKDSVMTKLQAKCIEKGIEFDSEYWSEKVDDIVKLTRTVNAQKGA